jgi:adenylate cyclase
MAERVAALYALGRFREAIEAALRLALQTRRSRLYRAAAHAAPGEMAPARAIVAEAVASAPDLTTTFVESQELYRDLAITRALVELLISSGLAGVPARQAEFGAREESA